VTGAGGLRLPSGGRWLAGIGLGGRNSMQAGGLPASSLQGGLSLIVPGGQQQRQALELLKGVV